MIRRQTSTSHRLLLSNPLSFTTSQHIFNMSSSTVESDAPIEKAITEALTKNLSPVHLEVINESYMHNVPKGAETHFKVLVVSSRFESLPLIKVSANIGFINTISIQSLIVKNVSNSNNIFRDTDWSMILYATN